VKAVERWHSPRLERDVTMARWGTVGTPLLLFPTAGGDAEECERCRLIDALAPLLAAGRLKAYSCDSIAGRTWLEEWHSPQHRCRVQNQFDGYVYHELVPVIRQDCRSSDIGIITAGPSIGAFNAVASLCRHPDAFIAALGLSGTYDLTPWLHGQWHDDLYYSSPLHYLPGLGEGDQLGWLRRRFVLLALGGGRWEDPEQSWRMAGVLGAKGIPNRVDVWGPEWDHDWPTWREMLPRYLHAMV
jgi:esterase/lipase superfamily enzyme